MKEKEYRMASAARGALLFMKGVPDVALGDRVVVRDHRGEKRNGQVIRTSKENGRARGNSACRSSGRRGTARAGS